MRSGGISCTRSIRACSPDGHSLWAVLYATEGRARSLFASSDVAALRRLYPDNPRFARLTSDDRVVASEPFSELPGVWHEIDESSAVIVRRGGVLEHESFRPQAPRVSAVSSP
jgi:predicted glutamine amidotransferase